MLKVPARARLRVQIFLKFCILVVYTLNINPTTLFSHGSYLKKLPFSI